MNTREKLIFLAGIIDGEGSISVEKKSPSTRKRFPHYLARLTITNTNTDLMQWIIDNFGGKMFKKNQSKSLGTQDCYSWHAFGDKLEEILNGILEFSIVKRKQIINILEFRKTVGKTGHHVTQEMRNTREVFYLKSRYLNSLHKIPSALSPVS